VLDISDAGTTVDLVVFSMVGIAVLLALLALMPWRLFGRAEAPLAAALIILAVICGVTILASSASVYGDGSTHWITFPTQPSW
jgi:cell division protein FtsW (lipid II flippase)